MVQAIVELDSYQDRIVAVVKGKYGLKTKAAAVARIVQDYGEEFLEPAVRPEYVRKLRRISKEPAKRFKSVDDFRKYMAKK